MRPNPPFVGASPPRRVGRVASDPRLERAFRRLFDRFGPRRWWPACTPFEVIVGAVLTQNTSWKNVERAIENLRRAGALSPRAILRAPRSRLEGWLRPSGYFRVKARRLRSVAAWFDHRYGGSIERLRGEPLARARDVLLEVDGVGPETADSILNYAAGRRTFVADAYTRRVLSRHGWLDERPGYEAIRSFFERRLAPSLWVYQEFHALLVAVGNSYCRSRPRCKECPLRPLLPRGGPRLGPK